MLTFTVDNETGTVTFFETLKFPLCVCKKDGCSKCQQFHMLDLQLSKDLYYNHKETLYKQVFENAFYWPESKYTDFGYLRQRFEDNNFNYQSGKMYELQYKLNQQND
jgi:hypothetical protein